MCRDKTYAIESLELSTQFLEETMPLIEHRVSSHALSLPQQFVWF